MEQFILNVIGSFIGSGLAIIIIAKPVWDRVDQHERVFAHHIARLMEEVERLKRRGES